MRKLIGILSLLSFGLLSAQAARGDSCNGVSAAKNLVSNCGFESGTFVGWSGSATTAGINYAGVDNGDPYAIGTTPYNGSYEAYLGSTGTTIALTETLATTIGGLYTIEFALLNDTAASTGYINSFAALFGGTSIFSETAATAGAYHLYAFSAVATSSSTTLSFVSQNDGGSFELDSVSVAAAAPEPSSFLLLATGLLGTVVTLRRRLAFEFSLKRAVMSVR